ncbi:YiiX/YebB-like N1pC/P60 family cysteine hydrolase [uncultured Chryseobacterium sp.]|uniref:YiiX/YebB-like N1pC/P60 family cysteine hydrolase n=1 Tax=uncultured Chryseobacterium sp. TaxID=259322 RepID=UPI0025F50E33|nr:YiiX/YebB-like N1pC/P60 family cysteine hydrolase [uncultured Chryseobacterium sp.]
MNKYIFDLNKIQEGDILLLNSDPRLSAIMKDKTGSVYHHAMLYTGGSSHIHSNKGPGVQAENTRRMLFNNIEDAIALRLRNPKDDYLIRQIIDRARTKIGTEYSGEEAKRTVQGHSESDFDPNRQFCTRFVAQAYAEGGVDIVKDPNYCTPFDLTNSEALLVIDDVLKVASLAEVSYANEENTVLDKQIQINNHILSNVRKISQEDIQTINQITEYVIANPLHDEEITALIEQSGYLDLWKIDIEKNPKNYNFEIFIKEVEEKKWLSASLKLADTAKRSLQRYETNLHFYTQQYKIHNLAYIKMHIKLYEKLVEITNQMMDVAKKLEVAAKLNRNQ